MIICKLRIVYYDGQVGVLYKTREREFIVEFRDYPFHIEEIMKDSPSIEKEWIREISIKYREEGD
jgi:hypothetical protein